jgi:hypothetical protein
MGTLANSRSGGRIGSGILLAALVLVPLLVLAVPAAADRVVTKSGDAFTGTITEEDAAKVVLKTISGTMTIPRDTIKTIEKSGGTPPAPPGPGETKPTTPAAPPVITAVAVDPSKAAQALTSAKAALVAGDWVKAGGLLEGLMALDDKTFGADDRLAATGALATCYLQINDAQGAARAMLRRAQLATDANDKKRLVAASEALRATGSVEMDGKVLTRYEEAVEAAMAWKAGQILKDAKELASKAQRLNEMAQLEKAANVAVARLGDADVYVPGYSTKTRGAVLEVLITNVLQGATAAMEHCENVRPELTKTRFTSVVSKAAAKAWNDKGIVYLTKRQAAEDALKNLKPFCMKFEAMELYTKHAAEIAKLQADADEYQYYPEGTSMYPPSYYHYYSTPSSEGRVKIKLRTF